MPFAANLLGTNLYAQGLMVDLPIATAIVRFGLAIGVRLAIGS